MSTKFTAGPWTATRGGLVVAGYRDNGDSWDCIVADVSWDSLHGVSGEMAVANAALIAAAPDLLGTLKDLAAIMEHVPEMRGINVSAWRDKARATIAAATGEGS